VLQRLEDGRLIVYVSGDVQEASNVLEGLAADREYG
jgi:hypothetical protein